HAPVHVFGWYEKGKVVDGLELPGLLSILAFHDSDATVKGLSSVPASDRPPVNVVRVAFQLMVGCGFALALMGLFFLGSWARAKRLPDSVAFHWAVIAAGPLALVALLAGWVTTEVGRQPWVVYDVMRTRAAVTGASGIPIGYATLVVVYAGLAVAIAWMLRRLARVPLEVQAPE
ncbi:MAG TPA: cytochrome ubiquinol oxidase subunit I, partial [Gaiellaceae bacterium]|nr:cytochrome ubiquinol oxidase subunit I [Gaiellaceae bacterium]